MGAHLQVTHKLGPGRSLPLPRLRSIHEAPRAADGHLGLGETWALHVSAGGLQPHAQSRVPGEPWSPRPSSICASRPRSPPHPDIWPSGASLRLLPPPCRPSPPHPSLVWGGKVRSVQQFDVGSLPEEVPGHKFHPTRGPIKLRH